MMKYPEPLRQAGYNQVICAFHAASVEEMCQARRCLEVMINLLRDNPKKYRALVEDDGHWEESLVLYEGKLRAINDLLGSGDETS